MAQKTLSVTGMSCGGCEQNVEDALGALDGVDSVDADNEADSVTVNLSGTVDDNLLQSTIEDAGYEVVG